MIKVKRDEIGFYYYEHELDEYRIILFRSKDFEGILKLSPSGTALESNYIDLRDAFMLCMDNDKEDLAIYLNQKFTGDHVHPNTPGAPRPRIVGNDILEADRNWSDLAK